MKLKREFIVLALLIAALSGYLVWQNRQPTAYRLPQLAAVAGEGVTRIQIDRPGQPAVEIKRVGDGWRVGPAGYAADADKIKGILEIIGDLQLTALVSEAGLYERYQLHEAGRIRVQAWAGETLQRDFSVGKSAPTYRHTFVTVAGDPKIYHAREDFRGRFDRDVDQLREKNIMAFKRDEIKQVRLRLGDAEPVRLIRQAPAESPAAATETVKPQDAPEVKWNDEAGRPVDGQILDTLLTSLSSLECERYLYDRTKADLESAKPDYVIELDGDRTRHLSLFAPLGEGEAAKQRPAISSESEHPFAVSAFLSQELEEQIAELTGKAADTAPQP